MAWGHGKALEQLSQKGKRIDTAIVDQFSNSGEIKRTISNMVPDISLDFQTKGEKNKVVAAASIMARGEYLYALQKISTEMLDGKVILKSGSGPESDEILKYIKANFSEDIFAKIAKLHFSNFTRI